MSLARIQAYVSIFSLIPTEPLWDVITDQREPKDEYTKEELYESIKKHGLKYMFRIDSTGKILDGNGRYWTCRRLVLEGDTRFLMVPVEIDMLNGVLLMNHKKTNPDTNALADAVYNRIDTKTLVIPPGKQEFAEYTFDDPNYMQGYQAQFQSFHVLTQNNDMLQIIIENSVITETEEEEEEEIVIEEDEET